MYPIPYFMKQAGIIQAICLCLSFLLFISSGFSQCNLNSRDTLVFEAFEQGAPAGWLAPESSDGGAWQWDEGSIGYYENPGQGNWAYVNDEAANNIGEAFLETIEVDLHGMEGLVKAEFDLLHQSYADSGWVKVEVWDGEQWWLAMEEKNDFSGHISLEISSFLNTNVKIRWTYSDQGSWSWGMGIDNFLLTVQRDQCGDGICGLAESPEFCPEDCPYRSFPAEGWVKTGEDIQGNAVVYRSFKGGTACDDCSEEIALPFPFLFYGAVYVSVFINANGNLTFEDSYKPYTPEPFCLDGPMMIAPFYADADLQAGGKILYYLDPEGHYMIVTWEEVGYFGCGGVCDLRNSFQAILTDGSIRQVRDLSLDPGTNVVFSYADMEWTTGNSSGGVEGFAGSGATVGLNSGNGIICHALGHFDRPGYLYYGSSKTGEECPSGAVSYLDYRSFGFNADLGEPGQPSQTTDISPPLLEAEAKDGYTQLTWKIDSQAQVKHFVIDRAPNTEEFSQLGLRQSDDYLPGKPLEYVFKDSLPPGGRSFYRVLQYNLTGGFLMSEQVEVFQSAHARGSNLQIGDLSLYPNPCMDFINAKFQLPLEGDVYYNVMDIGGRVVRQGESAGMAGENTLNISLVGLSTGNYILQLQYADHQQSQKFIKNQGR